MSMLFCLLMCPHDSLGVERGYHVCEAGFECQDLCDCQSHDHQQQCNVDSYVHEIRDDTALPLPLDFNMVIWAHVALLLDEPQNPFVYSDMMARFSSHSFAVRHLDTIILRV